METSPPSAAAPSCILIVEDEFLIAMELSDILQDGGYEVIGPVATVAAALAILEREQPHACILDVNLRGEHSAPVAHVLKERRVPFALSSAYSKDTLDRYAAFNGVTNLGKPVASRKLLAAIGLLLTEAS